MKYSFLSIIVILLVACNKHTLFDQQETIITHFPKTIFLKGEEKKIDTLGVVNITITDTFLIAYTPMHNEYYFHVFGTSNLNYLGSFLPVGRGPNEFYGIDYDKDCESEKGIAKVWVSNFLTKYQWNITESIKQGHTVIDSTFNLKGIFSEGIWYIGRNHRLFGLQNTKNNRNYILYDTDNQTEICKKSIFPRNVPYKNISAIAMNSYVKPDDSQIALVGCWSNHICIFNVDFSEIKPLAIYDKMISINEIAATERPDRVMFYSWADVTNQYLYCLYVNQPEKDRRYHSGNEEFHIFDWEGNPIMNIVISENIMFFAVDEKNKCLYGLTSDEKIYRYDLAEYLTKL